MTFNFPIIVLAMSCDNLIPTSAASVVECSPRQMHERVQCDKNDVPRNETNDLLPGETDVTATSTTKLHNHGTVHGDLKSVANEQSVVAPPELPVLSSANNGKRKRHRRNRKAGEHHQSRKSWKPYTNLTWQERRIMDEKEAQRATKRRQERFASGQPMAPYNTTQFLMEQHEPSIDGALPVVEGPESAADEAAIIVDMKIVSGGDGSVTGGEEESPQSDEESVSDRPYDLQLDEEETFLSRDFAKAYENYRTERMQSLSKDELVREYMDMETKLEALEKKLHAAETTRTTSFVTGGTGDSLNVISSANPDAQLQVELRRLTAENMRLSAENIELRETLATFEHGRLRQMECSPRDQWMRSPRMSHTSPALSPLV